MDSNARICLLVCAFAVAREFRPVEPFIAEFLIGPDVGLTEKQVVQDILVISTYASLVLVIVVFLVTDLLRYKPIVIADGVAGIMTYVLLLGRPSLHMIQVEQMFFAFFYSSDSVLYTYMYAKIEDKTTYNQITGYVRAAVLSGKFLSGFSSQVFVTLHQAGTNSRKLPLVYMSIAGMTIATLVSLLLPAVKHTFYFHRKTEAEVLQPSQAPSYGTIDILTVEAETLSHPIKTDQVSESSISTNDHTASKVIKYFWADFKESFGNEKVIVWAFWWSVGGAGFNLVLYYSQLIWKEAIEQNYPNMESMNGVVDCVYTALSAVASYKVGQLNVEWTKHSNALLAIGSICLGAIVLLTSQLKNIYLLYVCHIILTLTYHTMLTVAEFEIAKQIKESCCGLVFGFIMFVNLAVTTFWTVIIVEDTFFTFNIKRQFEFCAAYFLVIGVYYLMKNIQTSSRRNTQLTQLNFNS